MSSNFDFHLVVQSIGLKAAGEKETAVMYSGEKRGNALMKYSLAYLEINVIMLRYPTK